MASLPAQGIGWLRIVVGLTLVMAPRSVLDASTGQRSSGSMVLLARTIGIRDLVIGAGTLSALRSGSTGDAGRWITVGVASDAFDAVAGAAGAKLVGRRGAVVAAGTALPVMALGLWTRRTLAGG